MTDTTETFAAVTELRAHRRTFDSFARLVLFAILHIGLTLAGLALAFLAHVPLISLVIWIGGTLAMIAAFVVTANYGAKS
jgi:uncharacterized membrane protein (DUF485 family)